MKKIASLWSVCLIMILASCTKEGPQGPQGPPGTPGVVQIQTFDLTVNPGDWQTSSSTDLYIQSSVPAITQDIVDNGMVLVYLESNGFDILLPTTNYSGSFSYTFQSSFALNEVDIDLLANQDIATPTAPYDFKIVVASGQARLANPGVNWSDYNAVKALINKQNASKAN